MTMTMVTPDLDLDLPVDRMGRAGLSHAPVLDNANPIYVVFNRYSIGPGYALVKQGTEDLAGNVLCVTFELPV